jgi:hypothetical protein
MVGIDLPPSQNLLAYLLAASELAIGSLCLLALRSRNPAILRLTAGVLIIFHLASGVAGLAAVVEQASPLILWNAALRAAMIAALGLSMRASRRELGH